MIDLSKRLNLIQGDCLEVMKELPDASVDLVVTDPPYGYSFMNKDWDKAVPSVHIWKECLRVLKSGAFAFVMSAPRSDVQAEMILKLKEAGFEVGFTPIYWAYASGFPKASNISKMVDKRNGRLSEDFKSLGNYLKEKRGTIPQNQISKFFPSKTGGLTGCVSNWELGENVPTKEQWIILKRELKLDNSFDWLIDREEAERKVIKKDERHWGNSGFNMGVGSWNVTANALEESKKLDGLFGGFQPKPAVEIILVAMKPCVCKTFVEQALKNGHGGTWLGNCRIPYANKNDVPDANTMPDLRDVGRASKEINGIDKLSFNMNYTAKRKDEEYLQNVDGRFPANLLVSDNVLDNGEKTSTGHWAKSKVTGYGEFGGGKSEYFGVGEKDDAGNFSRYFSLDAWWEQQIKSMPKSMREPLLKTFPFIIEPKASKGEKNEGCEELEEQVFSDRNPELDSADMPQNRSGNAKKNFHPTVKPVDLMSYLVVLGSKKGEIVLDPFVGSGTTLIASDLMNRKAIGCELNKEYFEIAQARIKQYQEQIKLF